MRSKWGLFLAASIIPLSVVAYFVIPKLTAHRDYEVVKNHYDERYSSDPWGVTVIKDGQQFMLVKDTFIPMRLGGAFGIRHSHLDTGIFPRFQDSSYPILFLREADGEEDVLKGVWELSTGKQIWP